MKQQQNRPCCPIVRHSDRLCSPSWRCMPKCGPHLTSRPAAVHCDQIYLHVHGFALREPAGLHATAASASTPNESGSSPVGSAVHPNSNSPEATDSRLSGLPPPPLGRVVARLMGELMTKPATREEIAQINDLKLAHHSNLAMCHLRLGALRKARDCCSRALAIDATSVKSLFRRGRCHAMMGE